MKLLTFSICCILSFSVTSRVAAQTAGNGSSAFQSPKFLEAMAVCDNMGMYVQSAQRQATMGMPLQTATELVVSLMNKNLRVDGEVKAGAIALASNIYAYVYASQERRTESTDSVLSKTCGTYRGYNLSQDQIDKHLAETAPSAWNPMVRVPLCEKLAQSAANIATARDRGISREKISEVASASLSADKFTSARLPELIRSAYDYPDHEVAFVYGESLERCTAHENQREYPSLATLWERYSQCKSASTDNDVIKECRRRVLKVD